jgi:hypothetical protein
MGMAISTATYSNARSHCTSPLAPAHRHAISFAGCRVDPRESESLLEGRLLGVVLFGGSLPLIELFEPNPDRKVELLELALGK